MANRKIINKRLSTTIFSKLHLAAFALVFAGIGGYFIYKTFAAAAPPSPVTLAAVCRSSAWPAGSLLPARLAESTGSIINVSNSSQLRSALTSANPGQIIKLAPGRYGASETAYNISRSGTSSAPITIEGQAGVVLDTTIIFDASYIRVRNLEIDGKTRSHANGIYGRTGSNVEICGVHIHDVTLGGEHAQCIFTSSPTSRYHIINVIGERCGTASASNGHLEHGMYLSGREFLLANVLLRDHSGFGIQLYSSLYDSIVTHMTTAKNVIKAGLIQSGNSTGNKVFNTISVQNKTLGFQNNSGVLNGSYLIAYANGEIQYHGMSTCSNCSSSNPLLDTYFRPQSGSPAIGYTDPRYSPGFDLAGQTRDNAPDAGAYELPSATGTPPPPPPPPTVSLTANPTSISSGASSTLSWSSTNATSCTASGTWSGSKITTGTQSVSPAATSIYSLTCSNSAGSASASATVTVSSAPSPHIAAADLNNDGKVNILDLSILLKHYGTTAQEADINGDGVVNITDLSALLSKYE